MPPRQNPRKRAPNAFAIFVREHWRGRDSSQPFKEFNKELVEMWKAMTDEERNAWKTLAIQERLKFQKAARREPSMSTRSRPQVKRPRSAYIFFCLDKRAQVMSDNPEIANKITEVSKILSQMWSQLTTDGKEKYNKMAENDRKRYFTQLGKSPKRNSSKRSAPSRGSSRRKRRRPSTSGSSDTDSD